MSGPRYEFLFVVFCRQRISACLKNINFLFQLVVLPLAILDAVASVHQRCSQEDSVVSCSISGISLLPYLVYLPYHASLSLFDPFRTLQLCEPCGTLQFIWWQYMERELVFQIRSLREGFPRKFWWSAKYWPTLEVTFQPL